MKTFIRIILGLILAFVIATGMYIRGYAYLVPMGIAAAIERGTSSVDSQQAPLVKDPKLSYRVGSSDKLILTHKIGYLGYFLYLIATLEGFCGLLLLLPLKGYRLLYYVFCFTLALAVVGEFFDVIVFPSTHTLNLFGHLTGIVGIGILMWYTRAMYSIRRGDVTNEST